MAKGADAAMNANSEAVGKRENRDAVTVRLELMGQWAAVIRRTSTGVQNRQMRKRTQGTLDLPTTMVRQVLTAVEREKDDEDLVDDGH